VALVGDRRNTYRVLVGDLRERDKLKELGVDGRVLLNGSSRSGMRKHGLDSSVSR
jgi:hypothetical protein